MIPNPGFNDLDDLAHRSSRHSSVAPSVYEEAVSPESAKDSVRYRFISTRSQQDHLSGAHAILILDQAGWHGAKDLKVPTNISLLPLPPRSPELNPQENIWQFMRQNWLSNRVFKTFDDIVDHCCFAWNTLLDQPWKIMSIARRDWAIAGQSL